MIVAKKFVVSSLGDIVAFIDFPVPPLGRYDLVIASLNRNAYNAGLSQPLLDYPLFSHPADRCLRASGTLCTSKLGLADLPHRTKQIMAYVVHY